MTNTAIRPPGIVGIPGLTPSSTATLPTGFVTFLFTDVEGSAGTTGPRQERRRVVE